MTRCYNLAHLQIGQGSGHIFEMYNYQDILTKLTSLWLTLLA